MATAKASFFPYVAAAPAEAQAQLKNEAAALRERREEEFKTEESAVVTHTNTHKKAPLARRAATQHTPHISERDTRRSTLFFARCALRDPARTGRKGDPTTNKDK